MIDFKNKAFFKMKRNKEYATKVESLLLPGEKIVDSYKSMRDGVVFTDKRIIALNVQGVTGKKKDYTSIPYSKIAAYSVESAGTFDFDSELEVFLSGLGKIKFEFKAESKIIEISKHISAGVL
ncbi:MAG: PH domain-containing protein [Polyangia bacterium]